jgi:hypothetical protein
MSDEKQLPPDVAERYRRRLAEIRATMPHWGGGTHRPTPEPEARLEANIEESITRIMANTRDPNALAAEKRQVCPICGATEELVGKRYVMTHDFARHPRGEVPAKQVEVVPMRHARESEDDQIFGRQGLRVRRATHAPQG